MSKTPWKNGRYSGSGDDARDVRGYGSATGPLQYLHPFVSASVHRGIRTVDYEAAKFTETLTNSGTISHVAGGVALVSGATSGNNTTFQRLNSATIAANKIQVAVFRVNWTVVAKGKSAVGFFVTATDPIGTIPTAGAWISKDTAGTGAIIANSCNASTATSSTTLRTAVLATSYDFGIVINGTTNVQFWTKVTTVDDWGTPTTYTTNLPTGAMRWSGNITATDSNALTMTVGFMDVFQEA